MQNDFSALTKCLPSFLGGSIFALYSNFDLWMSLAILLPAFSFCLFVYPHLNPGSRFYWRGMNALSIHVSFAGLAIVLVYLNTATHQPQHFSAVNEIQSMLIQLEEEPVLKGNNYRCVARVEQVNDGIIHRSCTGTILVYFKNEKNFGLRSGHRLLCRNGPIEIAAPSNPGQFNMKEWLSQKQIYHSVYLKEEDYYTLEPSSNTSLKAIAQHCREFLLKIIRETDWQLREKSVLSALLLGYTLELDPETRSDFSGSGVMHILAVSGMHVGLIFAMLALVLRFPGQSSRQRIPKAIVIIVSLWVYALITGLSPSVSRAAFMLSMIVFAQSIGRVSVALNTLVASIFVLCLLNSPTILLNVGFQLSYAAVAGILLLYQPVSKIWTPESKILNYIWSILAMSCVAQLATGPLSIYYFHQFPVYFLPANLLVVSWSTLVMFGGIAFLFLSVIPVPGDFASVLINYMLVILNNLVHFFASLPGSVISNLQISGAEMILIYVVLICLATAWIRVRPAFILYACMFFNVVLALRSIEIYQHNQKAELVIYSDRSGLLIQLSGGDRSLLISDSLANKNNSKDYSREKRVRPISIGLSERKNLAVLDKKDTVLQINEGTLRIDTNCYKILHPLTIHRLYSQREKFNLIISGNPKIDPNTLADTDRIIKIITDASNSPYTIRKWEQFAAQLGIDFYNVKSMGAYVLVPSLK